MNWITQHPIFCTIAALYLIGMAWFVYSMRTAPYENKGDEIIYTDETNFD